MLLACSYEYWIMEQLITLKKRIGANDIFKMTVGSNGLKSISAGVILKLLGKCEWQM